MPTPTWTCNACDAILTLKNGPHTPSGYAAGYCADCETEALNA